MHDAFISHPCNWYDHQGNKVPTPLNAGDYVAKGGSEFYISKSASGQTINNGCCYPVSQWIQDENLITNDDAILCDSDYNTGDPNGGFGETVESKSSLIFAALGIGLVLLVVAT